MYRLLSIMIVFAGIIVLVIAGCKKEEQKNDASADPANTANAKVVPESTAGLVWIRSAPAGLEFTKSEVTVAQYRACVEAGKCSAPRAKSDNERCNWGYSDRDEHPVNCVDWIQANEFCEWAGGRLPTENEWYAEASNGGSRKYPWGDAEVTCDYAIWDDGRNTGGCGKGSTWPVCSKERGNSASGLCDMSGNLWEWTSVGHGARVVRGGAWDRNVPKYLLASYYNAFIPSARHDRRYYIGFRCGRSVK